MTIESFQDSLFEDPIGLRFRHAREKRRWSLESMAQQLKLPVAVLDAIEREDWPRLGAPIFVRSYIGSYAKILELPATLADEVVRGKPAPQLVAIGTGSPTRRVLDRGVMNLAYMAMTVLIVGSVVMLALHFQAPKRSAVELPLDAPSAYAGTPAPAITGAQGAEASAAKNSPTQSGTAPGAGSAAAGAPVMASLAPSLPAAVAPGTEIVMRFHRQIWVDVVDRTGAHVERGLVAAGTERRYATSQMEQVTLGDATGVDVTLGGVAVDLAPLSEANVARFTVSSDGKIAPAKAN